MTNYGTKLYVVVICKLSSAVYQSFTTKVLKSYGFLTADIYTA